MVLMIGVFKALRAQKSVNSGSCVFELIAVETTEVNSVIIDEFSTDSVKGKSKTKKFFLKGIKIGMWEGASEEKIEPLSLESLEKRGVGVLLNERFEGLCEEGENWAGV